MALTETEGYYCHTHDEFFSGADGLNTHIESNNPCVFTVAFKQS